MLPVRWRRQLHALRVSNAAQRRYADSSARYEHHLSQTARLREPSAIRALQPLLARPGMISLGGGCLLHSCFRLGASL